MKKRLLTLCVLLLSGTLFTACGKPDDTGGGTSATCGNRQKDNGEKCDKNAEGDDACPADQSACNKLMATKPNSCIKGYTFQGKVDNCTAECVPEWLDKDECNRTTGEACGKKGATPNATVGQTCNSALKRLAAGHCPTDAECTSKPHDACHKAYKLAGKALDCTAECVPGDEITDAIHGDGCCPDRTWSETKDDDCVPPVNMGEECTRDQECQAGNGGNDAYCLFYGNNTAAGGKKGFCSRDCDSSDPTEACGDINTNGGVVCITKQAMRSRGPGNGFCTKFCQGMGSSVCKGDDVACIRDLVCYPEKVADVPNLGGPCTDDAACGPDGKCALEEEKTPLGGMCIVGCQPSIAVPNPLLACPAGSICVNHQIANSGDSFNMCRIQCTEDSDCRDEGYVCNPQGLCAQLGKECVDANTCEGGQRCVDFGAKGGKRCAFAADPTAGKANGESCDSVKECQGDELTTICLSYRAGDAMCATQCKDDGTGCPTGYTCAKTVNAYGRKYNACLKDCSTDPSVCNSDLPPIFTCRDDIKTFDNQAAKLCGLNLAPSSGEFCTGSPATCTGENPSCITPQGKQDGVCAAACDPNVPNSCTGTNETCSPELDSCIIDCTENPALCTKPGTSCQPINNEKKMCGRTQP